MHCLSCFTFRVSGLQFAFTVHDYLRILVYLVICDPG